MPRVLFVTRKFPPSVGGMETLAGDVWASLTEVAPESALLVAHSGSAWGIPRFVLTAIRAAVRGVRRQAVDVILTGDVVMYLFLAPLARVLGLRLVTMAMGKDVVWDFPGYQGIVRRALPRAAQVLAISAATASELIDRGVPSSNVAVVRLGVAVPEPDKGGVDAARDALRELLGVPKDATVVALLGRLVRRKGAAWFLREVAPALDPAAVVVVAGDGDDAASVRAAAAEVPAPARVRLLGRVDDAIRELVMSGSDVFVQPNIPTPGDMEGFGLVAIEAAMHGSLVVAADLEGLRDAVVPGRTGLLVRAGDRDAWVAAVSGLLADPGAMRGTAAAFSATCRVEYSRAQMGSRLLALLAVADMPVAV